LTGNGLGSANVPDMLSCLGLDVDRRLIDVQQPREVGSDCQLMGTEFGLLGMNDQVAIDGSPSGPLDSLDDLGQKARAISALPLLIGVRKVISDIAQGCSTQKGICDGMADHVGIGMPRQPAWVRDPESAEYQRSSLAQPVSVMSDAYPHTKTPGGRELDFPKCI